MYAEQESESAHHITMLNFVCGTGNGECSWFDNDNFIAVKGKWKHSSWNDDKFCLHNGKMILIFTELWYFWYCKRKMFFFMINFDTATGKLYLNSFNNDKFWYRSGSSFLVWKIKSFLNHNYKLCRPDPNSEYGFTDLIGSRFNTDRDAPPCSVMILIQEN